MQSLTLLIILFIACWGCVSKTADSSMFDATTPMLIADFEEPGVLGCIYSSKGVTLAVTSSDAVSGKNCLEVRVKPFSVHKNPWPYIFLTDRYFPTPLDLSRHSRLVASVQNVTEGLATVRMMLSSKPYNDGGRNLEGEGFVIPGGSTMDCSLPTSLFRNPINDPSTMQGLMYIFPANETDAIYRIDAIQAVYDPAIGSPSEKLTSEAKTLLHQIQELESRVNWKAVSAERAATLQGRIPELLKTVGEVQKRADFAETKGWKGTYNQSRDTIVAVGRSLGEFVLADKTGFYLWQRPRYSYVRRNALPSFDSQPLSRIDLQMAGNEFRDTTWMVTACDRDVELQVSIACPERDLAEAVKFRWSDFVTPKGREEYGDVLVPLEGTLKIPRGESRELWSTFDTRWHELKPGRYDMHLQFYDLGGGPSLIIPVSLTVWDFRLPSYDILPNNAYVEYNNSEIGAQVPGDGVRHMKMYGTNMVYIYPNELPWPVKVDRQLNLTDFDTTILVKRITPILNAWKAAPGNERLRWCFALTGGPERLLEGKTIAYPSDEWKLVFGQWLLRFRQLIDSLGIAECDWMFVLADESSESALINYEIPFAEMIKSLDSKVILSCNSSQVINNTAMAERFFRVFDILQPNLDSLKGSPQLREWLGVNRRPIWTYRCQSMAGLDKNLYDYYRVYAWDNLRYGISGTGIWTYCAQGESPWSAGQRGIAYNLVFKHQERAEVVHSRRYEFYREGLDDYRYVQALLVASHRKGGKAEQEAKALIDKATADIIADVGDVTRCERWRLNIAEAILKVNDQH